MPECGGHRLSLPVCQHQGVTGVALSIIDVSWPVWLHCAVNLTFERRAISTSRHHHRIVPTEKVASSGEIQNMMPRAPGP